MKRIVCSVLTLFAVAATTSGREAGPGGSQSHMTRPNAESTYAAGRKALMDAFVDSLMEEMTLDEKIGQLHLPVAGVLTGDVKNENVIEGIKSGRTGGVFNVKGVEDCRKIQQLAVEESRLGIPLIFGLDVIHGYESTFPIPLAQAASWNMDLIRSAARISAQEASASGICWVYSPMLDVCRDPRWGRIAEGPGEDPFLASAIAKAMVEGYQGDRLDDKSTVMACVKHYALYGAPEGGRDYNTVSMSRQTAMNEYLPPYKAAVDAGAGSFMASFNEFEDVPATANKYLINELLRGRWGFDGFVVTDYNGITEMIAHGIGDKATVAARALDAGIDMDMVSESFNSTLKSSLAKGAVDMAQIDTACRRILEAKYLLGLFDDPYKYCDPTREKNEVYTASNRQAAREMGAETFVLMKNEGDVLPLSVDKKVALIGPLGDSADNMPGMWSVAQANYVPVSLYDGLKSVFGDNIKFAKGCHALDDEVLEQKVSPNLKLDRDGRTAAELRDEALALANESDVIIAAMGELMNMTGEGASRADITIPAPQRRLLDELAATGKPVVLVMFTGRPLVLTDVKDKVDAKLNVRFAGTEAGDAIADVVAGKVSPSGKLPVSFPYHIGQIPVHYNHKNTGRPMPAGEPYIKYRSNYQDIPNEPLYPFGYGLSYSKFKYDAPEIDKASIGDGETATVSVVVTNIGDMKAKETVQLYIRDVASTSTRPVKELKGFEKIELQPGQSEKVTFNVDKKLLGYHNHDLEYVCEAGEFELMVGRDSEHVETVKLTVED